MMKPRKITGLICWGILLLLSLFFISFESFHIEKNPGVDDSCPMCIFEKTTVIFIDLNLILPLFLILLFLLYKLTFQKECIRIFVFYHFLGQRAPPRYHLSSS